MFFSNVFSTFRSQVLIFFNFLIFSFFFIFLGLNRGHCFQTLDQQRLFISEIMHVLGYLNETSLETFCIHFFQVGHDFVKTSEIIVAHNSISQTMSKARQGGKSLKNWLKTQNCCFRCYFLWFSKKNFKKKYHFRLFSPSRTRNHTIHAQTASSG